MSKRSPYPSVGPFIDGQRLRDDRPRRPVVAPATGEPIAELALASAADVDQAIGAAEKGFARWQEMPLQRRSEQLRAIGQWIRARQELFASTIALELGKPFKEGLREAETAAEMFEWAAEETRRSYGRVIPARGPNMSMNAVWQPIGPIAGFTPWNAPAISPSRKISGALAAGCSIVLKPAEETPGAAVLIGEAVAEAGVPEGVVNLVFGADPAEIANRLIAATAIKGVTFTGSTNVGRSIARQAGSALKRMTLELGGHAPVLVFADADVEAVARGAVRAKYRNSGQVCTAPTRFYVHEAVYKRFQEIFLETVSQLKIGDPFSDATDMGPLANERRVSAMARFVQDARSRDVEILAGGSAVAGRGFFWTPTVFSDPREEALASSEEPFGPLALLVPFKNLDEALTRANRLPVGLSAYVFSHDRNVTAKLAQALKAGTLAINHWQASWPETPFGGHEESGLGLEGGIEGIQAFQKLKFISAIP